jgi:hypothetical protein
MVVSNSLASQGLKPPTGFRRETANPICGDGKGWAVCLANYTSESRTLYFLLIHPLTFAYLVGGLEHLDYCSIYWESSSQLTFIFFRGVGQPPSSYLCERSPIRWCHGAQFLAIQDRRGSVDLVAVSGCHQNAILNWFNLGWFGVPSILGKLQMNTLKRLQAERWTT